MIPVALIDYYRRAWDTFLDQDELDPIQREPRHYKIGHELAGSNLTVVIQGLLLPRVHDGRPEGIMRMSVGPSMRLRYSLETGELLDKHLLK